ncbi:MAG TPA: PH domain-containing protein [Staphylococcus sp.]|nr:PH domain-containing protein [Staphylococcus sp.]
MILDNVNPDDLFPTEKKGPSVLGKMEYPVQGEVKVYEAAYIATNERLILNVDMDGQFYYRNIRYDEIEDIELKEDALTMRFSIGTFALTDLNKEDAAAFVAYVEPKQNH